MTQFIETLVGIFQSSGFAKFGEPGGWLYAVMICVGCFLLYLAIVKEFEPLILLPMAFGMILANLPGSGVITTAGEKCPKYSAQHAMSWAMLLIIPITGILMGNAKRACWKVGHGAYNMF